MEAHKAQDITLVLMDKNVYDLSDGSGKCAAVVGMKDCLKEKGPLTDALSYSGWASSERREWLNSSFRDAFPSAMKNLFRSMVVKTANLSGVIESHNDYFSYFAEKEVHGAITYSAESEATLFQLDWYKTLSHRIKKASGRVPSWFGRSIATGIDSYNGFYCVTTPDGDAGYSQTENPRGISPFGCI